MLEQCVENMENFFKNLGKIFLIEKGNIQPKKLEIKFLQMAEVCHQKTIDVTSCYVGGN